LWRRLHCDGDNWLTPWPVEQPKNWLDLLQASGDSEAEGIRNAVLRGLPYGSTEWCADTARRLGIVGRLRGRGRPKRSHPKIPPDPNLQNSSRPLFYS
jgi:hypothetical protein